MKRYFFALLSLSFLVLFVTSCNNEKKQKMNNPLLVDQFDTPYGVPPFDKIKTSDFMPAFEEAMKIHDKEIQDIINNPDEPTFENTIVAIDHSGSLLRRVSNIFFNLNSANTNEEMQKIAQEISPKLSEHSDKITMNEKLFKRVKAVYDKRNELKLDTEDSMLLAKTYESFVRNGALLSTKS